jgi:phage portal protein BeeE
MNERAAKGGGNAVSLKMPSPPGYGTIGVTYGTTGEGSSWFGPGQPMAPQAPDQVAGRAFDFPQGVNLLNVTRPYEPITYAQLRQFADSYDLVRLIIETRKDAMTRLRWAIVARDPHEKRTTQKKNKIKAITEFLEKPDGENGWTDWLRMILEDHFVIDASSLYRRRTRSGKLHSLEVVDGATIRRVVDDWGRTPEDENDTAYQQILKGMPAVNYRKKDLYYLPRNKRIHKLYGYSPVEQILMTINIALRRQVWQLNFFTEGNMPPALIGVPETWTPDQIRVFQTWFDNLLTGNLAERRRARFVPAAVGKTYVPTQEAELFGAAEEWLARVCCFAFSISPLPFMQMMSRSVAESTQQEAGATGLQPIQIWLKNFLDRFIAEELDGGDFEFIWKGDDELDPIKRQQITSGYLRDGLLTVNEGRTDAGKEPYDDPRFDQPMFITSNGLAPMFTAMQGAHGQPSQAEPSKDGKVPADDQQQPPADDKGMGSQLAGGNKELGKIYQLVKAGDHSALAGYLRELQ